ncbi:MAG TPA: hypothetical protein GXX40_02610 [Firmicutes bacterium]|nr:hypothetical protein [Bacillota bacterium]
MNETLRMGNVFKFENLYYRALQRISGKSVNTRALGKYFQELVRKAKSAGGMVLEFLTQLKPWGAKFLAAGKAGSSCGRAELDLACMAPKIISMLKRSFRGYRNFVNVAVKLPTPLWI